MSEVHICFVFFSTFLGKFVLMGNIPKWHRCNPHHISNDMVVSVLRAVDSQDPKHDKNHGPSVDQRTHRRLSAHATAAWIVAECFGWVRFGGR